MSYHSNFLSSDKAELLRQIDAAIKQLKQQRFALVQPSRQMDVTAIGCSSSAWALVSPLPLYARSSSSHVRGFMR